MPSMARGRGVQGGCPQVQPIHGSDPGTPQSAKAPTSRVAIVARRARAMAASWASSAAIAALQSLLPSLRSLGVDAVLRVDDEAGTASADDALAGPRAG